MARSNGVNGLWVEGIKVVGEQEAAIDDPAALTDSPASADALRDDVVAKLVPAIEDILAALRAHGLIAESE